MIATIIALGLYCAAMTLILGILRAGKKEQDEQDEQDNKA